MLGVSLNKAFYHPYPSLQTAWNCAQGGLLVFPLSPFLGAVSLGFAVLFTWLQQSYTVNHRPLNRGFALLTILLLITAAFATEKTAALLGIFNFVPFFLLFVGLSTLIQTTAQLRQMAWILVTSSLPIVVIGLGQLFLGWSLQLNFLWIILQWTMVSGGEPPGRMSSILMHANTLAAYLVIIFILALGLWLETYQKLKANHQRPTYALIFLTVTVIANFIALILTNSRNGWAITIFTCLAFAIYQGRRILVSAVLSIITSVLLAAFAPSPISQFFRQFVPAYFWARLNDDMYPDRPVALMRKTQWEFAWSLSQQHPWTGWGIRSFTGLYKAHTQLELGHPHNLFLMLSAETGFPVTLLFFGLLSWILISGIKVLWKSNTLLPEDRLIFFSYLVVFFGWILFNTVDVTLYDFRLNLLSWWLFAAICGIVYRYQIKNPIR
jgi:O-antigen ligase